MKTWIHLVLIIILFIGCSSTTIKDKKRNLTNISTSNLITFYYRGKNVGNMTKEEFKVILQASENYHKEIGAEVASPNRLEVIFLKKPWIIKKDKGMYKTSILINWFEFKNRKKSIFKSLTLELKMKLDDNNSYPKWRTIYRNISEYGFPISLGFLILSILVFF